MTGNGDRPVPPDFPVRVVAESQRLALEEWQEGDALPLQLLTPEQKAERRALIDASIDEASAAITAAADAQRRAAILADPDALEQLQQLVAPSWEAYRAMSPAERAALFAWSDVDLQPVALAAITEPVGVDEFLVEGLIRPGSLTAFGAAEGVGKSFLTRELAYRCAAGVGPFLGRYPVTRAVPTLVIDEENGPAEEYRREQSLLGALGLERATMTSCYRISWAGVDLLDEAWQARIEGWIAARGVELLVLDALSAMHSVKELREYLSPIGRWIRRMLVRWPRLAVVIVHHLRKPPAGDQLADRLLGDFRGGWLGQDAHVAALAWPIGDRRLRFKVLKRVKPSDIILEQDPSSGLFRFVADAAEKPAAHDQRVIDAIDAGAGSVDELVAGLGIPERTAWNAVRRLRKAGILTARGRLERPAEDR